jgi:hypothetical protein
MPRPVLAVAILAVASSLVFLAACNADVDEGCLAGPCTGGGAAGGPGSGGAGAAASCAPVPKTGDFPCDVFAVIHANCNPCHQDPPLNGAPFPLLTYADTQKPYSTTNLIFQQMYEQIGPTGAPRMPLGGMLTADDYDTLRNWLAGCAIPVGAGEGCGCPGQGCTP